MNIFQRYSTAGKLSIDEYKQSIIDGYSETHGNIETTAGISQDKDILSLSDMHLGASPGGYEDYTGTIELSFIDLQSGDLSLKLLNCSCSILASGGVIVIEGFNGSFFRDATKSLKDFVAPVGFERIELDWEFTFAIKKLF